MHEQRKSQRPDWVSDEMFPFESRFFHTPSNQQLHYVDEGNGDPVVFVHGNPSWSFEFRRLIGGLVAAHRCISVDHIGFGLSSRSQNPADYHPAAHARNLRALLDHLELTDITLFLTDWGGPIGLDFARRHPDRIKGIIIANTWCWPVAGDFHFEMFSRLMASAPGQFMVKRYNAFVNQVMPRAVGDRASLPHDVMQHYRLALPTPESRRACAALPGYIIGASDWLQEIWEMRDAFTSKRTLLLWGFQDIAFREKELEVWKDQMDNYELHEFRDAGHFLAEEIPDRLLPLIRAFLASQT